MPKNKRASKPTITFDEPEKQEVEQQEGVPASRRQLYLLLALFILPFVLAWVLYNNTSLLRVDTTNYGRLVTPVVSVGDVTLTDEEGTDYQLSRLRGNWLMLYLNPGECTNTCLDNIYTMNQVRLALGRKARTLRPLLVTLKNEKVGELEKLIQYHYPMIRQNKISKAQFDELVKALPSGVRPGQLGAIYLVDPRSNLMMSYRADSDPTGILRDLKRLIQD